MIRLEVDHLDVIRDAGRRAAAQGGEAAGLLFQRRGRRADKPRTRGVVVLTTHPRPDGGWVLDEQEVRNAIKDASEVDLVPLAVWHTHLHTAEPSEADLVQVRGNPALVHLIVCVGDRPEISARVGPTASPLPVTIVMPEPAVDPSLLPVHPLGLYVGTLARVTYGRRGGLERSRRATVRIEGSNGDGLLRLHPSKPTGPRMLHATQIIAAEVLEPGDVSRRAGAASARFLRLAAWYVGVGDHVTAGQALGWAVTLVPRIGQVALTNPAIMTGASGGVSETRT